MAKLKPIKRSRELAPLSREHHNGLLFAWKIKQGIANGTPIITLADYTRWFWNHHIKPHFKDEEKVLVKFLPAENNFVKQMLREHAEIRDLVLSLDKNPDSHSLLLLANLINRHIRFEERQLFNYAEKVLTPVQLNKIFTELSPVAGCPTDPKANGWKEEFWVKKK